MAVNMAANFLSKNTIGKVLNHYLEPFICQELSLDLRGGCVVIEDVVFSAEKINNFLRPLGVPFLVNDCCIKKISVRILDLKLTVSGLQLTLLPHEQPDLDTTLLDTLQDSILSERADSFFDDIPSDDRYKQDFAHESIKKVLDSFQDNLDITFEDIAVRIEHTPKNSSTGVALEIRVGSVRLYNDKEATKEEIQRIMQNETDECFSRKLSIENVSLYTDEIKLNQLDCSRILDKSIYDGVPGTDHTTTSFYPKEAFSIDDSNPILFVSVSSQFSFTVTLNITTSAVNIASAGIPPDVLFFATPRQIYLLSELVSSMTPKTVPKNMDIADDYDLKSVRSSRTKQSIRFDLESHLDFDSQSIGNFSRGFGMHGWSVPDEDGNSVRRCGSTYSDVHSTRESLTGDPEYAHSDASGTTMVTQSGVSATSGLMSRVMDTLMRPKVSRNVEVQVLVRSLVALVLHEDVIVRGGEATYKELQMIATSFFTTVCSEDLEKASEDITALRKVLLKECPRNHFQFTASAININFFTKESETKNEFSIVGKVHKMEILECIASDDSRVDTTVVELVVFQDDCLIAHGNPCFNLSYNTSTPARHLSHKRPLDSIQAVTNVSVTLTNCIAEIDVTIVDRAEALFDPPSFYNEEFSNANIFAASFYSARSIILNDHLDYYTPIIVKNKLSFTTHISSIALKLRFPIPDLRPASEDLSRESWKRNVRNEILTLRLQDLGIMTKLVLPDTATFTFNLTFGGIGLYFQESADDTMHYLGLAKDDEAHANIEIRVGPKPKKTKKKSSPRDGKHPLEMLCKPSAFYEKNLITTHMDSKTNPLFYPANRHEFSNFLEDVCDESSCHITAHLPHLSLRFPSKHIYELLYNRLGYDILLWQPQPGHPLRTRKAKVTVDEPNLNEMLGDSMTASIYHSFRVDSDDDDAAAPLKSSQTPLKSSMKTPPSRQTLDHKTDDENNSENSATSLTCTITLGTLDISLKLPYRNENGVEVPHLSGALNLPIGNAKLQLAAGYKGDADKTYLGIFFKDGALMHNPRSTVDLTLSDDKDQLDVLITKASPEYFKELGRPLLREQDLLSLVMKFDFDVSRNANTMTLAAKIGDAVYDHTILPDNEMFFKQCIDAFSVQDYPISGYQMPQTINDVHLTCSRSVVRYKAQALNTEVTAYLGNLMFGSCMSYECDIAIVRVVLEDLHLSLSKIHTGRFAKVRAEVLNSEIFQLNWSRNEKVQPGKIPDDEITIDGNLVKLTAHTDTLQELIKLNMHLILELGMNSSNSPTDSKSSSRTSSRSVSISKEDSEKRKELIAEAIIEPKKKVVKGRQLQDTNYSPFTFPDDKYTLVTDDQDSNGTFLNDSYGIINHERFEDNCTILNKPVVRKPSAGGKRLIKVNPVTRWFKQKQLNVDCINERLTDMPHMRVELRNLTLRIDVCPGLALYGPGSQNPCVDYLHVSRGGSIHSMTSNTLQKYITRSKSYITVHIRKIGALLELYPEESNFSKNIEFSLRNLEIIDTVPTSNLHKLFCRFESPECPVPRDSEFLCVMCKVQRNHDEEDVIDEEADLRVSLSNIRMFIDQAAVTFILDFIDDFLKYEPQETRQTPAVSTAQVDHKIVLPETTISEQQDIKPQKIFFKYVEISPAIKIVMDFEGNFAHIRSVNDFMVAMASATNVTIRLKQIENTRGLLGLKSVLEFVKHEWESDIYANQKMSVMTKIVAPISLLIDFVDGFWKLIETPFRQYMKDGNILHGLVVGSRAFTSQSLSATFGIVLRLLGIVERVASFLMVVASRNYKPEAIKGPPPSDIRDSVGMASHLMKETVYNLANDVVESTVTEHRERGIAGAISGIGRNIPALVVAPTLLATQSANRIVSGIQNQMMPGVKEEMKCKYK